MLDKKTRVYQSCHCWRVPRCLSGLTHLVKKVISGNTGHEKYNLGNIAGRYRTNLNENWVHKVPYHKSQELRKCWRVSVIPGFLFLVPCGIEDHDHVKLKNWNLLGSDCCLDVAEGVETPIWMLTCWSMGLSSDWLGQLILVNHMYLLSRVPQKGYFIMFRTSTPLTHTLT